MLMRVSGAGQFTEASSVPVLEPPAVIAGLDDLAVARETIQERSRHLGVGKYQGPLRECQVAGVDDRRALVESADEWNTLRSGKGG